jgi:hypothetical protein
MALIFWYSFCVQENHYTPKSHEGNECAEGFVVWFVDRGYAGGWFGRVWVGWVGYFCV